MNLKKGDIVATNLDSVYYYKYAVIYKIDDKYIYIIYTDGSQHKLYINSNIITYVYPTSDIISHMEYMIITLKTYHSKNIIIKDINILEKYIHDIRSSMNF